MELYLFSRFVKGPDERCGIFYRDCLASEQRNLLEQAAANEPEPTEQNEALQNERYEMTMSWPLRSVRDFIRLAGNCFQNIHKQVVLQPLTVERFPEFQNFHVANISQAYSDQFYTYIFQNLRTDPSKYRVAISEGRIIGTLVCSADDEQQISIQIMSIGVDKKFHRCGVGSLFMKYLYNTCAFGGVIKMIQAYTEVDNIPAISFFRHHQFTITEKIPRYFCARKKDGLLMKRHFPARGIHAQLSL
ncbi:hypothetical protein L596_006149 [Steinernema carpocapsae]|uniref:N-terminal methionine N(alpha)-acetyltransferase NatE n=1 Tax=Steinernema carpocapsae TaxID=34508 RepID=A0A4U8V1B5_STECR|nr:hypothetical protein L596_006149 [Steinernema carpocapsae]